MTQNTVVEISQLSLFTSAVDRAWAQYCSEKANLKANRRKIADLKKGDAEYMKLKDEATKQSMALKARMAQMREDYNIDALDAEVRESKLRVEDAQGVLSESVMKLRKVSPQQTIHVAGKDMKIQIKAMLVANK